MRRLFRLHSHMAPELPCEAVTVAQADLAQLRLCDVGDFEPPWPYNEILARINPLNRRGRAVWPVLWELIRETMPEQYRQGIQKYRTSPPREFFEALRNLTAAGLVEVDERKRYRCPDAVCREWRERGWL